MFHKAIFSLFLFLSTPCFGEPLAENTYALVIGLGDLCQVPHQLSVHKLRTAAFPFDWAITSFESLYQFIANEGVCFLDSDKIVFVNHPSDYHANATSYIEDTVYHIQLIHDFELNENYMQDYEKIKSKYDRRVKRLIDALHSDKKILFVRRSMNFEQAVLLDELLHTNYPQLNYTLVALNNSEESLHDWGLQRVRNFRLRDLIPYEWWGHNGDWAAALSQFRLKDPVPQDIFD